jgi:hypothetical protein
MIKNKRFQCDLAKIGNTFRYSILGLVRVYGSIKDTCDEPAW